MFYKNHPEIKSHNGLHYFKTELELRSPIMKNGLTIMASPFLLYLFGARLKVALRI
jgi:hypothetical protein